MAKKANQKLRILYLYRLMIEKTDENHTLSIRDICKELEKYNIEANRQLLYEDFKSLNEFGAEVMKIGNGSKTRYYIKGDRFEMAELKVLIDAVQASKFLTVKKTDALINKLAKLNGIFDEALLKRQVYVAGRIKNMNDSIYSTTDVVHKAIEKNRMVRFQYFSWNIKKEPELRHDGAYYEVSPWALFWDNDKYYMVAYDFKDRKIKHYRVDKMLNVSITDKKRKGVTAFNKLDKSTYTQKHFGMFGGEEVTVTLKCTNDMANVIIDRFGREIEITPVDDEHFRTDVDVVMSDKFLAWVIALGGGVKVVGPEKVVCNMKIVADRLINLC